MTSIAGARARALPPTPKSGSEGVRTGRELWDAFRRLLKQKR